MKRDYLVYFFSLIIALFLVFMLLQKCSKTEQIKVNTKNIRDTIINLSSKIEQKEVKRDSVVKEIVKYKYLLGKETKYFIHDTIRIDSLIYLSQKQDTIIKIDSTLIVDFKNQIKQYQKLDTNWQYRFDSLSYEFGKVKVKYFKIGFYTGNVTGFAGSLLIKK